MTTLSDRLKNKEVILLDGGVSTEIQKRGVSMDDDVWSGIAHRTHPEITLQVHEDYIRAGAQVITANTFSTARHVLESIDLGDQVRSIMKRPFIWPGRPVIMQQMMRFGLRVRSQAWLHSITRRKLQ